MAGGWVPGSGTTSLRYRCAIPDTSAGFVVSACRDRMSRQAGPHQEEVCKGIAPPRRDAEDTANNRRRNRLAASNRLYHRPPDSVVVKPFASEFFGHPEIAPIHHHATFEMALQLLEVGGAEL